MVKVFVYKCLYYNREEEYNYPVHVNMEVALFYNYEDAAEYKTDFESNRYRSENMFTEYNGEIVEEEIL